MERADSRPGAGARTTRWAAPRRRQAVGAPALIVYGLYGPYGIRHSQFHRLQDPARDRPQDPA
ncbi:hypothetical protein AB0N17_06500 [Streptomyces sp. NPDC051133]|uniref:hypothetical protein n=1 Tax=Streptomyces sp. NPDC051133 TaxID=3155521 RepID=UPI00342C1B46